MNWLWWLIGIPVLFYFSLKMDAWEAIRQHKKKELAERLSRIESQLQEIREELKQLRSN